MEIFKSSPTPVKVLILFAIYFLVAIINYFILDSHSPYDPEQDSYGDGDFNMIASFMWPLIAVLLPIFLPFAALFHILDKIRSKSRKKRENAKHLEKTWEDLTSDKSVSNQDLRGLITDIIGSAYLKSELSDGIIKIQYKIGDTPKTTIIGRVSDYFFLKETCESNHLWDKPIQGMTLGLWEDENSSDKDKSDDSKKTLVYTIDI